MLNVNRLHLEKNEEYKDLRLKSSRIPIKNPQLSTLWMFKIGDLLFGEDRLFLFCLSIVFLVFILHICSLQTKMKNKLKISSETIVESPLKMRRTISQDHGLHRHLLNSDGNIVNQPQLKRNITYGHFLYFDEKKISKGDDYMYI